MSDYNMSGRLFKNDRKKPGSNQPDFRGDVVIDGIEFVISGWTKESKIPGGSPYISTKYERKEDVNARRQQHGGGAPQQQQQRRRPDDIPF